LYVFFFFFQKVYDLIAIGSGAGGLVSAKQSARRGAKSAMISELLAGGGTYPSYKYVC
jgi:pyruvate/2-oxoglutarate dehydrogenase complex dihydrolipoamide dehydrogenase (E3) component